MRQLELNPEEHEVLIPALRQAAGDRRDPPASSRNPHLRDRARDRSAADCRGGDRAARGDEGVSHSVAHADR